MTTVEQAQGGQRRLLSGRFAWPGGFAIVAIVVLLFYYTIVMGYAGDAAVEFARTWLPLSTVNQCLIWAMCALGLNIVVGYAGLLDLGYVAFWAIGSYVAGWLASSFFRGVSINILGNPAPFTTGGIHFNYVFVFIAGAALCALAGVIIGAPTLRLRSDYLAIVTLGFGEIIPQIFLNGDDLGGFNLSNGNLGITPVDQIKGPLASSANGFQWRSVSAGPNGDLTRYVILAVLLALIVFISLRLRVGRLGRAWLAIREDELAAGAMGVPLMRTKLAAYGVGALAGGIAGVGYSVQIGGVLPNPFDFSKSIIILGMVVLGGMGNVWGVMIGAIFLGWFNQTGLQQLGDSFNNGVGPTLGHLLHRAHPVQIDFPSYQFFIFGAVLVLMMLFRREGLIPEARTRLVLREPERTDMESLGSDMEDQAPELDQFRSVTRDDVPGQRERVLEGDVPRGAGQ